MMENMRYGQDRLKGIVKKEAEEQQQEPAATKEEEEAKEQHKDRQQPRNNNRIIMSNMIVTNKQKKKLVYEGKRAKKFRVTGNLNKPNTKMIMANITPHIEIRVKVLYSFKSEIHRGAHEVSDYSRTLNSPPGMFTSLKEIQAYIEECEEKWLDLDNEELWSKAYLPTERTAEREVIMKAR